MCQQIIRMYSNCMESLLRERNPGQIRVKKGVLVENMAKSMTLEAWKRLGKSRSRIHFDPTKIKVTKNKAYAIIDDMPDIVSGRISQDAAYLAGVDVHVYVDNKFILGIECKSYTENAMLKRILVDFWLLQKYHPNLRCCLLQLETQLGGSYDGHSFSRIANDSTYVLMSYFPDVKLRIFPMLEGSRMIDRPIHKEPYRKELKPENVEYVINQMMELLSS